MTSLKSDELGMIKSLYPMSGPKGEGWTTKELRKIWNCGEGRSRDIVAKAIEDGLMVTVRVSRITMAGIETTVPGYKMVKNKVK